MTSAIVLAANTDGDLSLLAAVVAAIVAVMVVTPASFCLPRKSIN